MKEKGHRCAGGKEGGGELGRRGKQASKKERKTMVQRQRKEKKGCWCMEFFSSFNGMWKRQEINNTNKSITDNYLGRTVIP
jgi:hypothetical protein